MEDFLGKFSCAGVVCHCLLLLGTYKCPTENCCRSVLPCSWRLQVSVRHCYTSNQIACELSSPTLYTAAVGTVWSLLGLPWNGLECYASFGVFAVQVSEMARKHSVFPSYQLPSSPLCPELASNLITTLPTYQQYTTTTLMTPNFCVIPVTCTIMQKNGAGLHTASSCFWDNSTDGSCTVRWENKTMYCIVSVFGLAI
jgi:hypothetical protein